MIDLRGLQLKILNFLYRLAKDPDIRQAIADLMDEKGLTQDYRIGKLKEHVDNLDPNVSLRALEQSWKLDGSYAPEKHLNVDLTPTTIDYRLLKNYRSDDELLAEFPRVAGGCDLCGNPTDLDFCEDCQKQHSYLVARVIKARVDSKKEEPLATQEAR